MKDLYEVLEITKEANTNEIRQSFRKLALKWHPDKHTEKDKKVAEEKFKEVSFAYNILINPKSKKQYDDFGIIGDEQVNIDINEATEILQKVMNDLFSNFSMDDDLSESPEEYTKPYKEKGALKKIIDFLFDEGNVLYDTTECKDCGGRGFLKKAIGFFVVDEICESCKGEGVIHKKRENQGQRPEYYKPWWA